MLGFRRLILAAVVIGIVGIGAELILLEHWESPLQWTPFIGLLAATLVIFRAAIYPTRSRILALRAVMLALVAVGAAGLWFHWRSNALLELEMDPSSEGWPFIRRVLFGGTPLLAPGAIMHLGLVGLVATFRQLPTDSLQSEGDDRHPLALLLTSAFGRFWPVRVFTEANTEPSRNSHADAQ